MRGRVRNIDWLDLASGVQRHLLIPLPTVDRRKIRSNFFCGETSGFGQNILPSSDTGGEDVGVATCSTTVHPYNDMPSPAASLSSLPGSVSGFAAPKFSIPYSPFSLPAVASCSHCFAKRFHGETLGFCCSNGDVSLVSYPSPPELWKLFTSNDPKSVHFRTYVRTYNNTFAFTSFGVK